MTPGTFQALTDRCMRLWLPIGWCRYRTSTSFITESSIRQPWSGLDDLTSSPPPSLLFLSTWIESNICVDALPFPTEEGIFTVIPDRKNKVYLRTPNWDRGLPSLASVSWNISVPSDQVACLTFLKERTGVVCQTGRAFMIIQEPRAQAEEIFSLEEELLPKPSFHHHNFWVNISNCSPVSGKQLDLLFSVSLNPRTTGKVLQGLLGMVVDSKLSAEE